MRSSGDAARSVRLTWELVRLQPYMHGEAQGHRLPSMSPNRACNTTSKDGYSVPHPSHRPRVFRSGAIRIIPACDTQPRVGYNPAMFQKAIGQLIDLSVPLPITVARKFA